MIDSKENREKVAEHIMDMVDEKNIALSAPNIFILSMLPLALGLPLKELNTIDELKAKATLFDTAEDFWNYIDPEQNNEVNMSIFGGLAALAYYVQENNETEEPRKCFDFIWESVNGN